MALLLCIDTAMENAAVSVSNGGKVIWAKHSYDQKNHASFVQPAIEQVIKQAGLSLKDIDAVAVVNGPGSYTGLRVGFATAKGLCFALNKPFITVSSLQMLALTAIEACKTKGGNAEEMLFCPMIDARRMEVFTAVFDHKLNTLVNPAAVILTESNFLEQVFATGKQIIFSGSGHTKFKKNNTYGPSAYFEGVENVESLAILSETFFNDKKYENLVYSEPFYLKEFYMNQL